MSNWIRSKYAIAANIAVSYCCVAYYVNSLVKKEIDNRNHDPITSLPAISTVAETAHSSNTDPNDSSIAIYPSSHNAIQGHDLKSRPVGNREIFDRLATSYDADLKWDERLMGLTILRRTLLRHAKGDVLELSVGTGRNLLYYPSAKQLDSLTLIDSSYPMLEKTVENFDKHQLKFRKILGNNGSMEGPISTLSSLFFARNTQSEQEIPVRFKQLDVGDLSEFPDNSFDTVIDTFGMCSWIPEYTDTSCCSNDGGHQRLVGILNEMARVCKPDGVVLLLEHGKSSYSFLNRLIDENSEKHFHKWGCHWGRDIETLINQSDLEIIYRQRWHFGTTYYYIARPKCRNFAVK